MAGGKNIGQQGGTRGEERRADQDLSELVAKERQCLGGGQPAELANPGHGTVWARGSGGSL
jgi:hypothetical protein